MKTHELCICFSFGTKDEVHRILLEMTSRSTTSEEINRIQRFVNENNLDVNGSIKEALNKAKLNVQWANQHIPIIQKIIKQMLNG